MLTKKDKQDIKDMVREAVREELTVEMTLEKHRDETTGLPLAKPEIKTERVFLPAFIVQTLSYNEGAFRGLQEDISKRNQSVDALAERLEAVGRVLIDLQEPIMKVADESRTKRGQNSLPDRDESDSD